MPIANYSANPTIDRETFAGTLELSSNFGNVTALSLTSYTDTDSTRYNDVDAREEFIIESNQPQKMKVFTQEFRLTSNNDGAFNWIAGAYYSLFKERMDSTTIWFDARVDADGNISGPLGCALGMPTCSGVWAGEAPSPAQEADTFVIPFEVRKRNKSHLAAFANANYAWNQWELDLGLRIDNWRNRTNNLAIGIVSKLDEVEVMPRVSLSRKFDGGAMVYATYAKGFEPGGFNLANFAGESELVDYGIEEASSFEVGVKAELFDRRVALSAAAFYIEYDARQVEYQTQRDNQIIEGIFNLGDSRQYGLEAEIAWRATDSLSFTASAGWIDAEWVDGTQIDLLTSIADLSGKDVPNVNDFSWVVGADFEQPLPWSTGLSFLAAVQVAHNGKFEGLQVWDPVRNPSYTLVNAQVGLRHERWEFIVQAENLTDEDYFTDVQRFPNLHLIDGLPSVNIGTLGPPRLFSASFKYKF